jgi:hypothetical protein
LENKLIVTGVQTPSAKEFEQMLDQRGIKSPLRQVRDFLRENPDHIDAMTDLLTEVRRRALHVMPQDATEDLDTEADLRTWGVLAAETDRVFSGNWLGIELGLFRPDKSQPERVSNLMKASFRKHIPKVESALRLVPVDSDLWNIWAWMASSLPDYKWGDFVNIFEPVVFRRDHNSNVVSIPSSEACVWIVAKALGEKDWATMIKFAPIAKWCRQHSGTAKTEWLPGGDFAWMSFGYEPIEGYPIKSAYVPLLEALLRTGDIDGANAVFDEMLFRLDKNGTIAAGVARSVGMEDLAAIWEKGEPFNKVLFEPKPEPWFLVLAPPNAEGGAYMQQLIGVIFKLPPSSSFTQTHIGSQEHVALGWKIEDGNGWALISADGHLLAKDSGIPSLEDVQAIFDRFNIKSQLEIYKKYMADHGSSPQLELLAAFEIYKNRREIAASTDGSQDENSIAEFAWYLNKVMREHPGALAYLPSIWSASHNEVLTSLSKQMLANIELLLLNKPSTVTLWNQWIFWKNIEGSERSLESMVESVKLSPLAKAGTVPPSSVIDYYFEDCKRNGSWNKVIGLLKTAWDREFLRLDTNMGYSYSGINKGTLGDRLGVPLIEAYLQDGRPNEANEIFNAVLGIGGKFTDISKIAALAKEKGQERLAREWGERVKK